MWLISRLMIYRLHHTGFWDHLKSHPKVRTDFVSTPRKKSWKPQRSQSNTWVWCLWAPLQFPTWWAPPVEGPRRTWAGGKKLRSRAWSRSTVQIPQAPIPVLDVLCNHSPITGTATTLLPRIDQEGIIFLSRCSVSGKPRHVQLGTAEY